MLETFALYRLGVDPPVKAQYAGVASRGAETLLGRIDNPVMRWSEPR
jgi:hypothetical protein